MEESNSSFSPFQKRKTDQQSPLRKSLIGLRNSKDDVLSPDKTSDKAPISRSVSAFDMYDLLKQKAASTELKLKKAHYKIVCHFIL
jgi:hypothetical protein